LDFRFRTKIQIPRSKINQEGFVPNILIVDDEENIRKVLKGLLNKNGFDVVLQAPDGKRALELIQDNNIDIVISDINMPVMDGLTLFSKVKDMDLVFIFLTAYGTVDIAVDAIKAGAYDFIPKPFNEEELVNTLKKAAAERTGGKFDIRINSGLEAVYFRTGNPDILKIKESLDRVVKSGANVFLSGETGTGKGLLAKIMHGLSPVKTAPFIKVNCAAIPASLMEAELFGYNKGAFTGASIDRPGKFELADGGTLFLDEIGELTTDMQAKLLAALQDRETTRLGGVKPVKFNARIIAATNIDIKDAIAGKKFREDLYFRLNVVEFRLPPLKERRDDIPQFIEFFVKKYSSEYGMEKKEFDSAAAEHMKNLPWRGNIRELENVVQKIMIMEKGSAVKKETLDNYIKAEGRVFGIKGGGMFEAAKSESAQKEAELIKAALDKTGGNKTKAAEELGISRRTLLYRIKEYGL
jgi:two-component system, NtrC family, response regulator AtoC